MPDGAITPITAHDRAAQERRERTRKRMLSADRERDLVARWQQHGERDALDRLLRAYEPLCQTHAKRFEGMGERGDLLQEARLGLLDAVRRFDPAYGTRLSTYAGFWVEERLRRFTMETQPLVRIPRHTRQWLARAVSAEDAGAQAESGDSNRATREVAERHGVDETVAAMAAQLRHPGQVVSLDQPAPTEDGDSRQSPLDLLRDPAPQPDQQVAARHDAAVRSAWLREAVAQLDERKAAIVRRRHLSDQPMTLEDLAEVFGVSKERVRQLEAAAFRDLRRMD